MYGGGLQDATCDRLYPNTIWPELIVRNRAKASSPPPVGRSTDSIEIDSHIGQVFSPKGPAISGNFNYRKYILELNQSLRSYKAAWSRPSTRCSGKPILDPWAMGHGFSSNLAFSELSPTDIWKRLGLGWTSRLSSVVRTTLVAEYVRLKRLDLAWLQLLGVIIRVRKSAYEFGH